uniref:Uncharacterized protein n=1 Tax=Anguilla anguilla TaxID=7936 RepID=A0A0E9U6J4_ANGAN
MLRRKKGFLHQYFCGKQKPWA